MVSDKVFWWFKSDQTVAGLKLIIEPLYMILAISSNQTVAGLKRSITAVSFGAAKQFKSDRCGIETLLYLAVEYVHNVQIRPLRDWNHDSPYHEAFIGAVQIRPLRDWNRSGKQSTTSPAEFKSDRCGIETSLLSTRWCPCVHVQIRPLRDWNMFIIHWPNRGCKVQIRPLRDWNYKTTQRFEFTS